MTTQPTQEAPMSDVVEAIIKPLKWSEPHASVSYPDWHAQVVALQFSARIDTSRALMFGKFPLSINGWTPDERFDTLEEAKAFAEQYYRNRVLELLDLSALASTAGDTLKAENERLRKTCVDVAASLAAALSILQRANSQRVPPRQVAPSNKMFAQMMIDYQKSLDRARTALGSDQ